MAEKYTKDENDALVMENKSSQKDTKIDIEDIKIFLGYMEKKYMQDLDDQYKNMSHEELYNIYMKTFLKDDIERCLEMKRRYPDGLKDKEFLRDLSKQIDELINEK